MPVLLPSKERYRIGVISDTHGRLPARVAGEFRDVDLILHAGDIGSLRILNELESLAALVAVRGNMDWDPWARGLPERDFVRAAGFEIHVIHDLGRLRLEPDSKRPVTIVSGHTHRARVERKNGVLYVNPGSAGSPRFGESPSAAVLTIAGTHAEAEIIALG